MPCSANTPLFSVNCVKFRRFNIFGNLKKSYFFRNFSRANKNVSLKIFQVSKNLLNFFQHEVIEFPAVLIEISTGKTIAEFHSYVRPQVNTVLTDFCTSLTGISQQQVDNAPYFKSVFTQFQEWLCEHNLLEEVDTNRMRIPEGTIFNL